MLQRLIAVCLIVFAYPVFADTEKPLPRQLVAFYDSKEESTVRFNLIHRFLEMPANHLGYNIQYHDINEPLPKIGDDVHGIILWFYGGMEIPKPKEYLKWLLAQQAEGKKILILENTGITSKQLAQPEITELYHALMTTLGLRDDLDWTPLTYQSSIIEQDANMVGFERKYGPTLPAFSSTHILQGLATSHLRISPGQGLEPVDLVVTNANGGYIANDYAIYMAHDKNALYKTETDELVQWYVNPFTFLKTALDVPIAPVPDVTTLNGRRIFYSHIDGDGWNSLSEIPEYAKTHTLSSEVMLKEILRPYSDIPFTVGLITADIDTKCYGLPDSGRIAREIYALSNVEPSSHTHSHPLFWRFFANYSVEKEKPFLEKYPPRPSTKTSIVADVGAYFDNPMASETQVRTHQGQKIQLGRTDPSEKEALKSDFRTPRSYACSPYDLKEEIIGSIDIVNKLSPAGKKARLIQWSGNTSPYEDVLTETRKAGFLNINGGDSRLDREYPSYAWVAPIGLQMGKERQIYSSNSNENTYTNLWTDRFFGFRYLQNTVQNTESPIRLAPFNLYFHIYSAQKDASLRALKDNLNFARSQPLIPITTSEFASIANGFYSTTIISIGENTWAVENRGDLQTVRINDAGKYRVNMQNSEGVLGFRHYQDNLYISLNPTVTKPIISLININNNEYLNDIPYLVESSWQIKDLRRGKKSLTFEAAGFGKGVMVWQLSPHETYEISVKRGTETLFSANAEADVNGLLNVTLSDVDASEPVSVTIEQ
ncbi:MAG: polysaccharide deacetylase family protein [Alphaproteobacteria bacterium]